MIGVEDVINLKMLAHPLNWAIVLVVVLMAAFAMKETKQLISGGGCGCDGNA